MSMTSNFDPDQLKLAKGHFIDNTWLNEGTGLRVRRASDLVGRRVMGRHGFEKYFRLKAVSVQLD